MKLGEHFNMNRKSNLNQYVIDFSNIEYYRDIHYTLQESLDFPDYYGCNWDACWDCLKGLTGEPLHIEIIGLDVVERKFDDTANTILKLLRMLKHYNNDRYAHEIMIELVKDDIRIEIK